MRLFFPAGAIFECYIMASTKVNSSDDGNNSSKLSGRNSSILTPLSNATAFIKIVATLPVALLGFVLLSYWHEQSDDPDEQTIRNQLVTANAKTPILLLHGSNANQKQWFLFRRFLVSHEIGNVFSLNMNKARRCDDHDRDILDYSRSVHNKLLAMKELYAKCGVDMDKVILIGNSMGGLVAGAYCIEENPIVKVKAVITISTPWGGTKVADWFCDKNKYPEKYFCTDSVDRQNLVEKVVTWSEREQVPIYNYGSAFDLLVPVHSSHIPGIPNERQHQDNRNDHWTTMLDGSLARFIREQWVKSHTEELEQLL